MNKLDGKMLDSIEVGDKVVVRRTSGAEQEATVTWARDKVSRAYAAPELVSWFVTFDVEGKPATKGCNAFDIVRRVS